MKYIIFFITFLFSNNVFSEENFSSREEFLESMGLSDNCEVAAESKDDRNLSSLQRAYFLSVEFRCKKAGIDKSDKNLIKEEYHKYSESVNKLIATEFNPDIEHSVELLRINSTLVLNASNYEKVRKAYIDAVIKNPPEDGEHAFQPERFTFEEYKRIISKYYSEGMIEDAERVIEELSQLPYQYSGEIANLRQEMHIIYKDKLQADKSEEAESPKSITTQEQEKPQSAQEAAKPQAPVQAEKPTSEFKAEYIYILIAALVLLVIGAGVWLRSRK